MSTPAAALQQAGRTSGKSPSSRPTIDWIVRPAQPSDADNVNRLLKSSCETLLAKDYDADLLEIVLPKICTANESLLTSGTWYVVLHPDDPDRAVGCGGWTPHSPLKGEEDEKHPHLRHFATDPNCARQGIGKQIWNRSWRDLLEHFGGTPQTMEVLSTLTAETFYSSLGFEKVRDMTIPFGENADFPCILMRRDVKT